jgi:hypothetical protein
MANRGVGDFDHHFARLRRCNLDFYDLKGFAFGKGYCCA